MVVTLLVGDIHDLDTQGRRQVTLGDADTGISAVYVLTPRVGPLDFNLLLK